MTTAVVTGAAGFVGSHLSEKLVGDGHDVIGIDSFSDFYPRERKLANLSNLLGESRFRLAEGDLSTDDLSKYVRDADLLFHLAAQPGVRTSWGESFSVYLRDNILATQRLLEASKGSRLRRFVFASSSSVYGDAEKYPTGESAPTRPNSPYGVTKLAAENLCRLYHRNFRVPVVVLRYFTVYGPRQRPDMGIYRFIDSLLRRKTITLYGDGKQSRDFTYVSDIVEGTALAADAGVVGETINLGGGRPTSIIGLISMLEEITGLECKVEHLPVQKGDVVRTSADIRKARAKLRYRPKVSLDEGLKKQLEWQESLEVNTRAGVP
ncbi:MAG: NAD-dependent epimerase/dehydratase family protein [Nitrososphaerales archaeon]|nr:NAD-dependent epimerase/dehydratase family protein [Nitrososphaerales archaeon]